LAEGIISKRCEFAGTLRGPVPPRAPYLRIGGSASVRSSRKQPETRPGRIRIRYAGEVAEVGTHLLRSAVLAGVLKCGLDEKVNVVNAPAVAASRGLSVEEETRRREHGFPNTLEVSTLPGKPSGVGFTARAPFCTTAPRACWRLTEFLEAQLAGTILYLRNSR